LKKHKTIYSALFLVFLFSGILLWKSESKKDVKAVNVASSNYNFSSTPNSKYYSILNGGITIPTTKVEDKPETPSTSSDKESSEGKAPSDKIISKPPSNKKSTSSTKEVRISRGGTPPKSTSKSTYQSKIETLDWWKEARHVFETNSIAVVTDVNTNKSFKVKRTMGTNHADAEALTSEDTKIIKSIWGGFSWERRPVIVEINGRKLAASMSAMPHAGIDSAPAFKVVSNRSLGYGRGENLDVIKSNGMDGHFDIHFLNSTRHKDGKKDPEHQTAIKSVNKK
jgi:hypothetical protein